LKKYFNLLIVSKENDEVSIYADISLKCTKGADAKKFVSQNPESVRFIGNGILLVNRDDLFKSLEPIKSLVLISKQKLTYFSLIIFL